MIYTAQKWSFQVRISSVNVTKSTLSFGFGHIYWRIINGKLDLCCSVMIINLMSLFCRRNVKQFEKVCSFSWKLLRLKYKLNSVTLQRNVNVIRNNSSILIFISILKSDSHLPRRKIICVNESPSTMMKNALYFILKVH